jgi:hypothetical protein
LHTLQGRLNLPVESVELAVAAAWRWRIGSWNWEVEEARISCNKSRLGFRFSKQIRDPGCWRTHGLTVSRIRRGDPRSHGLTEELSTEKTQIQKTRTEEPAAADPSARRENRGAAVPQIHRRRLGARREEEEG